MSRILNYQLQNYTHSNICKPALNDGCLHQSHFHRPCNNRRCDCFQLISHVSAASAYHIVSNARCVGLFCMLNFDLLPWCHMTFGKNSYKTANAKAQWHKLQNCDHYFRWKPGTHTVYVIFSRKNHCRISDNQHTHKFYHSHMDICTEKPIRTVVCRKMFNRKPQLNLKLL